MTTPNNVQLLSEAIRAVLMGENQTAQHKLLQIKVTPNKGAPETGRAPLKTRWKVFQRDQFTCRYCGRQTIFMPILVALSFRFTEDFPFPGENKNAQCHGLFWTEIPVVDKVVGDRFLPENCVTCCYSCHTAKSRFPDPARWRPKEASRRPWDGLSAKLRDLCVVTKTSAMPYFFEWMKVIDESQD